MNANDVKKLRTALGLSQGGLSKGSGINKATLSRIENAEQGASPSVAVKLASVTGADPGVIYGATQIRAIVRAVDEEEIDPTSAADKLLRVLSVLLERFPDVESAEGGTQLLDTLEAALEENMGQSVEGVRGSGAKAATKSAGAHPMILKAIDHVGTGAVDPREYTGDVGDGRGFYGERLSAARLRDAAEHEFEDVGAFDTSNVPLDDDDDFEDDGRDALGRSVRPIR